MNLPPIVNGGGPYVVEAGRSIVLDASNTYADQQPVTNLNFAWDLNGNGIYGEMGAAATNGDEVGVNPTFIAPYATQYAPQNIGLRVIDSVGFLRTTTTIVQVITPPMIAHVSSIAGGAIPVGTTSMQVDFSQPVIMADSETSYSLRSSGPNGVFGDADDEFVAVTANYNSGTSQNTSISVAGNLFNSTILTPISGSFTVKFTLYVDPNGMPIYTESRNLRTDAAGAFTAVLGAVASLPTSVFNGPLYCEVRVFAAGLSFKQRISVASVSGTTTTLSGSGFEIRSAQGVKSTPIIGQSATLSFGSGLSAGTYRLTVSPSIMDPTGIPLDGTSTETAGTNFAQDFVVTPAPKVLFSIATTNFGAISADVIANGDLNSDGIQDLVIANKTTNKVYSLLATVPGQYGTPTLIATGEGPSSIAIGRLNSDTKMDLAITYATTGKVAVFFGKGDGTFQLPVTYSSRGESPQNVKIVDVNGDGGSDLVIANQQITGNGIIKGNNIYSINSGYHVFSIFRA